MTDSEKRVLILNAAERLSEQKLNSLTDFVISLQQTNAAPAQEPDQAARLGASEVPPQA